MALLQNIKKNIVKGYSHEKFKLGRTLLYKYSEDLDRRKFILNQYNWLKYCTTSLSDVAFRHLQLIIDKNETGIIMNYIKSISMSAKNAKDIVSIAGKIRNVDITNRYNGISFEFLSALDNKNYNLNNYIEYIKTIVFSNINIFSNLDWYTYEKTLQKFTKFANINTSFHHGDFTIDNILWDGKKYTLIDPNFKNTIYGSYLLDLSKLFQETRFSDIEFFDNICNEIKSQFSFNEQEMYFLYLLELSHYIRMIPYVIKYTDVYLLKYNRMNQLIKKLNLNN